jgi:hypothetical protein
VNYISPVLFIKYFGETIGKTKKCQFLKNDVRRVDNHAFFYQEYCCRKQESPSKIGTFTALD